MVLSFVYRFRNMLFPACVVILSSLTVRAQEADPNHLVDHKPLMNAVWETFDELMYKVTHKDGQTIYTPHFPESLKRLDGKTVTLKGYMVPIEPRRRHNVFLLSVLPVYQCMFCGQNGIPPMAEITMADNTKLTFGEEPITIKGTVFLNGKDENRAEIQLHGAIKLQETNDN
ncbi:hypothetical protein [Parapedobacter koreensis]|uniref:DUF3299 domain-containing protein n=1 Tax=Parapedobacter koreensis TaxID=332977 RepID=A0A1H7IDK4_9SPHI|nr:hypothetical protein [Parapedobacter koreensis]SEK60611.1 hypothetical protein SAMN05421740_102205 [Parapedobacter koreensis]